MLKTYAVVASVQAYISDLFSRSTMQQKAAGIQSIPVVPVRQAGAIYCSRYDKASR